MGSILQILIEIPVPLFGTYRTFCKRKSFRMQIESERFEVILDEGCTLFACVDRNARIRQRKDRVKGGGKRER